MDLHTTLLLGLGIDHEIIIDHRRGVTDRVLIIIDYVNSVTFAWNLIKHYGFYSKVIKIVSILPQNINCCCFDDISYN